MLGLIRRVLSSTAIVAIAGCPGDPTEANSGISSASDDTGGDATSTVTADDTGVSMSITDTAGDDTDPTDDDTGDVDLCGNGTVEPPETCDLGPNNTMGATCTNECRDNACDDGYVGYGESCEPPNSRGCNGNCISTSCGDSVIDPSAGEQCDPPTPGMCTPLCRFPGCGDGFIDPGIGEQCEGNNLDNQSCLTLGYFTGDLQCDAACRFVISSCTNCGNASVQDPEQCDGGIGGATCASIGLGFDEGDLSCTAGCLFDTSQCVTAMCGNNEAEGDEICDGTDLNGNSCLGLGFAPTDDLMCANCSLDSSGCTLCGNAVVDMADGEECEAGMLPITMCSALPATDWDMGNLGCAAATCQYDESACCGDDVGDDCVDNGDCCGSLDCSAGGACCMPLNAVCGGNDDLCCTGNCSSGANGTCIAA